MVRHTTRHYPSSTDKAVHEHDEEQERPRTPHRVDLHVGNRLKQRRIFLGLTQDELGDALGLTFQQIQKYEKGANRISSSRLYLLAQTLDVRVGWFFEDYDADAMNGGVLEDDSRNMRDEGELQRAAFSMTSDRRRVFLQMARVLADVTPPDGSTERAIR